MELKYPIGEILKSVGKVKEHLTNHDNILLSISGGGDSDIMLDLLLRVREENEYLHDVKFRYVFFDTGIEYKATREHLDYLEQKYNIKIERMRALKPVPLGCKEYGVPFLTKYASQMIERLQRYNFDFKNDGNKSYTELIAKYPKCKGGIMWWTNQYMNEGYRTGKFCINNFKYLKEFMILNPPDFKISDKCCQGAKKDNAKYFLKNNSDIDMECLGIRKAEGGIRSQVYKNCYDDKSKHLNNISVFRPIFWYTDTDKKLYEETFGVCHSKCYTEYGFKRTGCCSCPFGSDFETELEIIKDKEPLLYLAVNNIFRKSYEYTRKYREYKEQMKALEKAKKNQVIGQLSIEDLEE